MSGYTLDQPSLRRIGEQVRKGELRPTDLRERSRPAIRPPAAVARFRLVSPLEVGQFAAGRMLQLEPTGEPGQHEWIPTGREETVFAAGTGWNNHWPEGTEVTCVATAAGWMVTSDQLVGVLPTTLDPFPYMVLRVGGALSSGHDDTILLGQPGLGPFATWDDDYVVTGAQAPPSKWEDLLPGERTAPRIRTVGCTPVLGQPLKMAYKPFDGLLPDGNPIPASILEAMGQDDHPSAGELWGPTRDGKLSRTLTFLEIFWWELCSPEWECRTFTVPNPDYDPFDPDNTGPPTIQEDFWAVPADCSGVFGLTGHSGVLCSDPAPTRRAAFWRSPNGWWGRGGWSWGWWGGYWNYPYSWWGNPSLGFSDSFYWGPWGYGWWTNWWNGRPPTPDDLLELPTDQPPPDPPCGGLIRRYRYGFVVWEYGWRVLGADTENEVCTVVGEFEFRNRLVIENPDAPQPSCDDTNSPFSY